MAAAYERQLCHPDMQQQAFDVRFGLMLEAECSAREARKIERLIKAARLRESQATLEDVDYKASRGLDRSLVMSLAECEWLRRRQNLILPAPQERAKPGWPVPSATKHAGKA